ncbi:disulfide bond formation protein B [Ramlibacter alkalitolerans]|uniref:Disulfide bond formation protein B n=1 Tax=Ramlibacter alkalitolerans TaxID=2039631 RepID=A0ABS1JL93_9BURK|nr:disulfide bond formation protein B [Ramlibacter alkalitolerans]MBL0425009.1 disulfide bond formation protein B [Ramlibacter alkalitolerans]
MSGKLLNWFDTAPRRVLATVAVAGIAMLCFGLYLQLVVGLVPCPMCIVQRYALILVVLIAALAAAFRPRGAQLAGAVLMLLAAGFGAFVAARQSWLQWYPPEVASCGRDFYGMIENFPLRRAIPMIFKGSGDCTKIDWTFLGGSLANWSFVAFSAIIVVALTLVVRQLGRGAGAERGQAIAA